MSQPRYPRKNQLPSNTPRSPRRELVGLSLLAAVALAPKCGAMPYTSYGPDYYPTDVSSRQDSSADTRQGPSEDCVDASGVDRNAADIVYLGDQTSSDSDVVAGLDDAEGTDGQPEGSDTPRDNSSR